MNAIFRTGPDLDWLENDHPRIADRLRKIQDFAQSAADVASLRFRADQQARDGFEAARTNHGRAVDAEREGAASETDVLRMEAEVRRARERLDRTQAESLEIIAESAGAKTVAENCLRLLNNLRPVGAKRVDVIVEPVGERSPYFGKPRGKEAPPPVTTIKVVPVELPAGDPAEIAERLAGRIGDVRAELADLDHAVPRKATVLKRLPGLVEELAARGAPRLEGAGAPDGRLRIAGPRVIIHAEPARSGPGWKPTSDDALAMQAWLAPDRVLEKLKADLETAYAHGPVELDAHEKQRRSRDLKAQILEAERVECAALWKQIDEGGEQVRFRPDTDPRAILGIA
ncbi:hypothetical protein [Neoaquamicrobium sediminum]|uniref:hypothetical protein n=1 Tax=Neoaquamicrobium sediminum TaxID=1849104 RepID=UPI0040364FF9